jgi:hypothetical protein
VLVGEGRGSSKRVEDPAGGARDERSSAIRRLQAIMPRHQATPITRDPWVLVGEGRVSFRDVRLDCSTSAFYSAS